MISPVYQITSQNIRKAPYRDDAGNEIKVTASESGEKYELANIVSFSDAALNPTVMSSI